MAELEQDDDARAAWLTFVVVGGGPTGVEIAGQIAELGRRAIGDSYTRFGPNDVRVILCDGGKEILATFGDRLSQHGTKELERTGVEIRTEAIVQNVDATGVEVRSADGSTTKIASRTVIWAAGVAASPLARMLADASGAECDRAGRIAVQPDCSLPGHPEVFAVGDMMSLNGLPGVAEVAMQTGIHAARTISGRLKGQEAKPFKYRDLGSMADHLPPPGDRQLPRHPAARLPGLAGLADGAHHLHDRLQEPVRRAHVLELRVPRSQPPAAGDQRAADARPGRARRAG